MENDRIPWARTTTAPTVGQVPVPPPGPIEPLVGSAPAVAPPARSGRRTAVAAALAIGFASVGGLGAAAVLHVGSSQGADDGRGSPGEGQLQPGGQLQQGQLGQQSQQTGQAPAVRVPGDEDDGGREDEGEDDSSTS